MRTQEAFTISILDCAYKMGLKFSNTYLNTDGLIEHIFHVAQISPKPLWEHPLMALHER